MPARSLWSGSISFGLVNIPVRLVSAIKHREVQFHLVHQTDGSRIYEERFCRKEDKPIEWDEVAKGFKLPSGRTVVVTPAELDSVEPEASRRIGIEAFVKVSDVDPIYYQHTYYLAADTQGKQAYALLLRAMEEAGRAALGRIVMRQRQYVCLLRPFRGAIALSTLLYADEVVPPARAGASSSATTKPSELKVARSIVSAMQRAFRIDRYKDEHRAKVQALIKRKGRGKRVEVVKPTKHAPTRVADLLKQLEKSKEVAAFAKSRR